jgi:Zn-dependent protease with chaperone function
MEKNQAPLDVRKHLRQALFKSLLIPVLTLAFFIAAPHWLNQKLRTELTHSLNADPNLSPEARSARLDRIARMDFQQVCLDCPPGEERLHANLERAGVVGNFQRLRWGLWLSLVLVGGLGVAIGAVFALNRQAGQSQAGLIHSYRLSWKIAVAAALAKVFFLIPLLTYGLFEFSVLLSNHYFPKLLLVIILGGVFALWKSAGILLKKIPLEFNEPLAREVTPAEAPELWQAVRTAAGRLHTTPPDRILIGLQLNFYVTELAVKYETGRTEGKTLFLSLPLLRQLSEAEIVAIIGHELGHFIGEDTKLTREFYPLRLKVQATMLAMARSGWVGWPSAQFLNFFTWCFGETERTASRSRELLADQKAAALTSPSTAAGALVRFQVAVEAFQRGLKEAVKTPALNPLDLPLQTIVQNQLAPETAFWTQLFEKKLPHPLDTHPSLQIRLEALGQTIGVAEAQAIALAPSASAYAQWLAGHDTLFASLNQQAVAALAKMRSRSEVVEADYQTASGRELLDRHFPEKRWRVRPASYWVIIALLAIVALLCLTVVATVSEAAPRIIFGLAGILLVLVIITIYRRNHGAELVLTAEGLRYSGWTRPLLFKDVKNLTGQRSVSNIVLVFHWKTKQPPLARFSLRPYATSQAAFSLGALEGKPAANAETIFKYFTRQAAP